MKIFISWSGSRSQQVAEFLSSWIRQVIQTSETWISTDIDKGTRWNETISEKLEQTRVGIICLTKENLTSNWLLFESGALSKTKDAIVGTFLLDVKPSDVEPPLSQFQHTLFEKEDLRKLVQTINNKTIECKEKTIEDKDLNAVFDVLYPSLESKLIEIRDKTIIKKPSRTDRDLLEEVLSTIRELKSSKVLMGSSSESFYIESGDPDIKYVKVRGVQDSDNIVSKLIRTKPPEAFLEVDSELPKSKYRITRNVIERNDLCPCGSGKKFKLCHGKNLQKDLTVNNEA